MVSRDVPIDSAWISYNVNRILGDDAVVVNEDDMEMKKYASQYPAHYFCSPHAGYLGWGVGAALGIKLGSPDAMVVATVGDGSYVFSVPSACHLVSSAYELPILVIVYNNQGWQKVRRFTQALHPDGWAARTNRFPLCAFQQTVHFEKFCEACGGYGERVETPDQLPRALDRALYAVKHEKRQALLNVMCKSSFRTIGV